MPKTRTKRLGVAPRGDRYQARPYIDGKHHWAGTWDTEKEAEGAAERKIEEVATRPPHEETIASFLARHGRDYPRAKPSTNDAYEGSRKRFRERVDPDNRRRLHEYTVPEAMAYWRAHPQDAKTMRAVFEDARREGLLRENVWSRPGIPKSKGRRNIVAITAQELDLLVQIAQEEHGKEFGPVFATVIEWAADTTMRPSEIFGLDRGDVDLRASKVQIVRQFHKRRIQKPKNGLERILPFIPPRAEQAFRSMPRRVPPAVCSQTKGEILFPNQRGGRISQQSLSLYWSPVRASFEASIDPMRRAELRAARNPNNPEMDFYELRHFGATQMAELGVEPWVGAEMMGHTDGGELFRTTYSHPSHKVAAQRLRAAFGKNVKQLRPVEGEEAANG